METLEYDIVVIGAGPAGSKTAAEVARAGHRVLLLEKRTRVGAPVRCAEAIGPRENVERFIELDPAFIASPVNGLRFVAPNGETFEKHMNAIGFVLDRELFDRRLAETAVSNGAELRTSHQAMGLLTERGRICGVEVKELSSGKIYHARSAVVVGADGVEALSPRWAGLKESFKPGEIFSCAQELIDGVPGCDDIIEFHLGSRFAPGGYAWVFPKGGGRANVGTGINPLKARGEPASSYLDRFLRHRCPDGKRTRLVIGGCSVARGLPALATDGFLAVGEAAHQNNPFSGGGIINALEGAEMATEAILEALRKGDAGSRILGSYTKRWNRSTGKTNEAFHRVARIFYDLNDADMSRIIARTNHLPSILDERGANPVRMLFAIVKTQPLLLPRLVKSFAGYIFRS